MGSDTCDVIAKVVCLYSSTGGGRSDIDSVTIEFIISSVQREPDQV